MAEEPRMLDVGRGAGGSFVVRVNGVFDMQAAERLARWLAEIPKESPVTVDFTKVNDCHDFGIAAVAGGLQNRGEHLDVRGLTRHQARLLRYLGVYLAEVGAGAEGTDRAS